MESITCNVRDIATSDRRALEHVLGQPLCDNQQLMISVVNLKSDEEQEKKPAASSNTLPDWFRVYEGLSDEEIADIERRFKACQIRSHECSGLGSPAAESLVNETAVDRTP